MAGIELRAEHVRAHASSLEGHPLQCAEAEGIEQFTGGPAIVLNPQVNSFGE